MLLIFYKAGEFQIPSQNPLFSPRKSILKIRPNPPFADCRNLGPLIEKNSSINCGEAFIELTEPSAEPTP